MRCDSYKLVVQYNTFSNTKTRLLNPFIAGQTFDLGLQHKYYNDPVMIKKHIDELEEKIDLVLIMEYFDESLVLLKRELCWDLDDVVYFKLNQRSQEYKQTNITDEQQVQCF